MYLERVFPDEKFIRLSRQIFIGQVLKKQREYITTMHHGQRNCGLYIWLIKKIKKFHGGYP